MNSQLQFLEFRISEIQDELYKQELQLIKNKNILTKDEIKIISQSFGNI